MKSIRQVAEEIGVSPQSVYARLKRFNISIDSLKPEKRGKERLFDDSAVERIKQTFQEHVNISNDSIDALKCELEARNVEIEALKCKIQEVQDIRDEERRISNEQITNLTEAVKAANVLAVQAQTQLQLKAASKPSVWQKLFGRKTKEG